MPPGANGLCGPAYVRWKAEQRWKRSVARLGESIPAPDVSGLGPCSVCGTTDIATHGWLGDPISGTCVPCDAAREKRVATLHAVRDPDAVRVVTAVPDTDKKERPGFSVELIEDVKAGDRVKIRKADGQITRLYEVIRTDGARTVFRQAWRVEKERDPWEQPTQRPPWTDAH